MIITKKLSILLFFLCITYKSNTEDIYLKKRSGRVSESSIDTKQQIGNHYKKSLTDSANLIALESKHIKNVAEKTEQLLNNDALFSGPQAALYEKKLAKHVKQHEELLKQREALNKEFEKDFELS